MIAYANQLGFRYRGRTVFESLNIEISSGITGVLGPNGAGKSTLMLLLSTRRAPFSGELFVLGEDVTKPRGRKRVRQQLGYLPQRYPLVGSMEVLDTVAYAAWTNGMRPTASRRAAGDALSMVGISDLAGRRVRTLSGGQRQRVGLAAAVAHGPTLLLLDEPTAGLDPEVRLTLRRTLAMIADRTSIILATHLIEDVVAICEHTLVLQAGEKVFQGSTAELQNAGESSGGYELGTAAERGYAALLAHAGSRGK